MREYWTTEDADPRHVYHDVLIALDEARGINNGQPSLWALLFDELDIAANDAVLHLGCGTGYYTAIAAELAGPLIARALERDETDAMNKTGGKRLVPLPNHKEHCAGTFARCRHREHEPPTRVERVQPG